MQYQIITIYCVCADFLCAYGYRDDPQTQMTTAEVMTVALVAATFFVGNQELSRRFLKRVRLPTQDAGQKSAQSTPASPPGHSLAGAVADFERSYQAEQPKSMWSTVVRFLCATTFVSSAVGFTRAKSIAAELPAGIGLVQVGHFCRSCHGKVGDILPQPVNRLSPTYIGPLICNCRRADSQPGSQGPQ